MYAHKKWDKIMLVNKELDAFENFQDGRHFYGFHGKQDPYFPPILDNDNLLHMSWFNFRLVT